MMKRWKILGFLGFVALGVLAAFSFSAFRTVVYPSPDLSAAMSAEFEEYCLLPTASQRPAWECYEITASGPEHQEVVIRHSDGEEHRVITFQDQGETKFRFTPSKQGVWTFSTGGEIEINADRPDYAKGFVAAQGNKWIRTATGEAFVPQFIMYDKPTLKQGLDEFVDGHGFTGFHITNLRDFMNNPAYFEAAVLKTYRRGGVTHFWIWGDEDRKQTPRSYGVDADRLYAELAARLAPIPGWTLSYGFDLFEWASAEELEALRQTLRDYATYSPMLGGRGHKNEYREISSNLDYASWEWHQPTYEDYREHLEKANNRPVFSEDRFRIRTPTRYPEKDYNPELTRRGLWDSAMAGGIANIWGHQPRGKEFSEPYPNQEQIKTYSTFINKTFTVGMQPDDGLSDDGHCLKDGQNRAVCYFENTSSISLNTSGLQTPIQVFAVDAKAAYEEIAIPASAGPLNWDAPRRSDWAVAILSDRT